MPCDLSPVVGQVKLTAEPVQCNRVDGTDGTRKPRHCPHKLKFGSFTARGRCVCCTVYISMTSAERSDQVHRTVMVRCTVRCIYRTLRFVHRPSVRLCPVVFFHFSFGSVSCLVRLSFLHFFFVVFYFVVPFVYNTRHVTSRRVIYKFATHREQAHSAVSCSDTRPLPAPRRARQGPSGASRRTVYTTRYYVYLFIDCSCFNMEYATSDRIERIYGIYSGIYIQ